MNHFLTGLGVFTVPGVKFGAVAKTGENGRKRAKTGENVLALRVDASFGSVNGPEAIPATNLISKRVVLREMFAYAHRGIGMKGAGCSAACGCCTLPACLHKQFKQYPP